jgi:hypothetical protein
MVLEALGIKTSLGPGWWSTNGIADDGHATAEEGLQVSATSKYVFRGDTLHESASHSVLRVQLIMACDLCLLRIPEVVSATSSYSPSILQL